MTYVVKYMNEILSSPELLQKVLKLANSKNRPKSYENKVTEELILDKEIIEFFKERFSRTYKNKISDVLHAYMVVAEELELE